MTTAQRSWRRLPRAKLSTSPRRKKKFCASGTTWMHSSEPQSQYRAQPASACTCMCAQLPLVAARPSVVHRHSCCSSSLVFFIPIHYPSLHWLQHPVHVLLEALGLALPAWPSAGLCTDFVFGPGTHSESNCDELKANQTLSSTMGRLSPQDCHIMGTSWPAASRCERVGLRRLGILPDHCSFAHCKRLYDMLGLEIDAMCRLGHRDAVCEPDWPPCVSAIWVGLPWAPRGIRDRQEAGWVA